MVQLHVAREMQPFSSHKAARIIAGCMDIRWFLLVHLVVNKFIMKKLMIIVSPYNVYLSYHVQSVALKDIRWTALYDNPITAFH